jgi:signal transduction histidine kinase/ActR/RegA family two-component response regulator
MTVSATIALVSAGIAGSVAALSFAFSRAPGWREQRHFSVAALAGAAFSVLNVPTNAPVFSDAAVVLCSRLQLLSAAVHCLAWIRYSRVVSGAPRSRLDALLVPVLATLGAVGAVTPAFLPGEVRVHAFDAIGAVYRTALTSPAGDLAYGAVVLSLLVPIVRFAVAWRRGVPNAGVQLAALVTLVLMGLNDTLVVAGVYSAPYLLDIGFLLPAVAVGSALTSRFVRDMRALEALRQDLERQVAQRTAELGTAQEALHRAEKLAALGQFSTGVAHEVNNPAAVVSANLHFLSEHERDLSPSARDAVQESLVSVQRIVAIVRQLLDAGRLATSSQPLGSVSVRALGDSAISAARARFGKRVWMGNLVGDGVWVSAQEGLLAQVLVNLVVNGVQAISDHRSDGRVIVRAEPAGDRVRVVVEDNGTGIEPDVLRRVFEPFFTTKPFGSGTGLGLAVSRGLVIGLGGDLRLESEPGRGTRAIVELAAAAPAAPAARRAPERSTPRLRILVVDDEPTVLSSLRRLLEARYGIEVACGVDEALAWLEHHRFDLVLCDVMMPAGGGERLYRTLLGRAPASARRLVFFTGGAVTDAARQFLREQPQPVLYKPLDLEKLARAAEQVRAGALSLSGS